MRSAILVIDMIVDFTTGKLGSKAARTIRPAIGKLLAQARRAGVPVVYCQDSHLSTDPELKVWGLHGMFGTPGAQTDRTLKPRADEPIIPKHTFSGFFGTDLDEQLRDRLVDTVILTGVATEICVQHTAADAFSRGYRVVVAKDGTAGLTPEAHARGLEYMAKTYGAKISDSTALSQQISKKGARKR